MRSLRDDLFTHMQDLPIRYFDTHAHGDIMSVYTNDVDTLRQLISPRVFHRLLIRRNYGCQSFIVCMLVLSVPLDCCHVWLWSALMVYLCRQTGMATLSGKYFVQQQKDLGDGQWLYRGNDGGTESGQSILP